MAMIYADWNATSPLHPRVKETLRRVEEEVFGNASSIHSVGITARNGVEEARKTLLASFGPGFRLIFTSSATEANNLALLGIARSLQAKGRHIVTSLIEHPCVMESCKYLRDTAGFEVTFVSPGADGRVEAEAIAGALRDDTILVTVMHGNNETGLVQPVEAIGARCQERGILFHSDMVQSFGKTAWKPAVEAVDSFSLSAHKFGGPKGAGALAIRNQVPLEPQLHGGAQEKGLRPGTYNTAAITGLGEAWRCLLEEEAEEKPRLLDLRKRLEEGLQAAWPVGCVNGSGEERLWNTVNYRFTGCDGEMLVMALDLEDVAVSMGSACSSGTLSASPVLLAMGLTETEARASLRFSLGRTTTHEETGEILHRVRKVLSRFR